MSGEKFGERAKAAVLYEQTRGGDIERMLERGPQNSRVNEAMARWIVAVRMITLNWRGKYFRLFDRVFEELQDMYLDMEGYSRKQAIELRAAEASAMAQQQEQAEKRGGLLGLLGK